MSLSGGDGSVPRPPPPEAAPAAQRIRPGRPFPSSAIPWPILRRCPIGPPRWPLAVIRDPGRSRRAARERRRADRLIPTYPDHPRRSSLVRTTARREKPRCDVCPVFSRFSLTCARDAVLLETERLSRFLRRSICSDCACLSGPPPFACPRRRPESSRFPLHVSSRHEERGPGNQTQSPFRRIVRRQIFFRRTALPSWAAQTPLRGGCRQRRNFPAPIREEGPARIIPFRIMITVVRKKLRP